MGFAAGFGDAFKESFLAKQQQDAVAERDAFQIAYQTFQENKKNYDADAKRDKKARDDAKRIVQGLPGVSANAWTYAYEWLLAGYTPAQVEDKLTTTKFAPIPTTPQPEAPAAPSGPPSNYSPYGNEPMDTGPDTSNVNIQTADEFANANPETAQSINSGIGGEVATPPMHPGAPPAPAPNSPPTNNANPADVQAPPPEVVDQTEQSGLLGDISAKIGEIGNPAQKQANMAKRANAAVAGAAGVDPAEMDRLSVGFTPDPVEHLLQAIPNSVQGSVLANYDLVDSGFTPAAVSRASVQAMEDAKSGDPARMANAAAFNALLPDIKAAMESMKEQTPNAETDPASPQNILKLLGNSATERQQIAMDKANVATMAATAKTMGDMAQDLGAINTIGAQGVSLLNTIKNNVASVADVVNTALANGQLPDESELWAQFEQKMNDVLPGWEETAAKERQFSALAIRFIYSYAKTQLGQSSSGTSNRDIERLSQTILNSNDPTEIVNNLKSLVLESSNGVNNRIGALREVWEVKNAIQLEGGVGKSMLDATLQPIDLGPLGEWANSPTPTDIPTNVLKPGAKPAKPNEPVPPKPDKSQMPFNRSVLNEEQARELSRQRGRPISKDMEYRIYEDGSIGVKGFDY